MSVQRHTVRRIAAPDGRTLCFMVYLGSRSRGWRTFEPEDVPAFEGKEATFEVEVKRGKWAFLGQVE
jgi:hypothetical protein